MRPLFSNKLRRREQPIYQYSCRPQTKEQGGTASDSPLDKDCLRHHLNLCTWYILIFRSYLSRRRIFLPFHSEVLAGMAQPNLRVLPVGQHRPMLYLLGIAADAINQHCHADASNVNPSITGYEPQRLQHSLSQQKTILFLVFPDL